MSADVAALRMQLTRLATQTQHWRTVADGAATHAQNRRPAAVAIDADALMQPLPTDMAAMQDAVLKAEDELLHWRKAAGRRSCERRGVGPTGGFCMQGKQHDETQYNYCLPQRLAASLGSLFANQSVVSSQRAEH